MNKVREELDEILLKVYRLKDLSELLEDYFATEICQSKFSKGDTLASLVVEKVKEIDKSLDELYKTAGSNQ